MDSMEGDMLWAEWYRRFYVVWLVVREMICYVMSGMEGDMLCE